jgi:4-diphosphocytidyl-2C-methyl-D-erythritol kinase
VQPVAPIAGWAALLLPSLHCATAKVYETYRRTPRVACGDESGRPPVTDIAHLLSQGDEIMRYVENDLEIAARRAYPELGRWIDAARCACGEPVCMTGSGAACFWLSRSAKDAARVASAISQGTGERAVVARLRT